MRQAAKDHNDYGNHADLWRCIHDGQEMKGIKVKVLKVQAHTSDADEGVAISRVDRLVNHISRYGGGQGGRTGEARHTRFVWNNERPTRIRGVSRQGWLP